MTAARKREAPATALPKPGDRVRIRVEVFPDAVGRVGSVVSIDPQKFRGITVLCDATPHWVEHEHTFTPSEIEPIRHPSESNASRRSRGGWRCEVWLPEEYRDKLDALCEESGFSRAEQIEALIDFETSELARIKTKKARPA